MSTQNTLVDANLLKEGPRELCVHNLEKAVRANILLEAVWSERPRLNARCANFSKSESGNNLHNSQLL